MFGYELAEDIRPILSELIEAVHVEGNLLHSLRVTPAENTVVIYVASINVATKVQTGKEKTIIFSKDKLNELVTFCEEFVNPVGFTMEGETYHWFFFPDMAPMDTSKLYNENSL